MRFRNEASWDRILRAVVGVVGIWLGFAQMGGVAGVVVGLVGVILLVTGAVGWCPIYAALKTGTERLGTERLGTERLGTERLAEADASRSS